VNKDVSKEPGALQWHELGANDGTDIIALASWAVPRCCYAGQYCVDSTVACRE